MNKVEKIYLLVTIDTECDHDPHWVRSKPLRFESINIGLPQRLQPVFQSTGAIPTYLLTVEVMEDPSCVQTLRSLGGAHEFGTHLHSAFIEPEKKYLDYAGVDSPDFQCHCRPEIEFRKLENLTNLFVACFGRHPKSFRAGRYGAGANTIDALSQLGYALDTSVTPYIRWEHADGDVDYRHAPEQPYYPEPGTLTRPATDMGGAILEIPVSMRPRLLRGPRWLRPWFTSVEEMKKIVRYQLRRHRDRLTIVLNMMFHSMEVIPKASPYPQTESEVQRFLADLAAVLDWCRAEGVTFSGAADFAGIFRQRIAV